MFFHQSVISTFPEIFFYCACLLSIEVQAGMGVKNQVLINQERHCLPFSSLSLFFFSPFSPPFLPPFLSSLFTLMVTCSQLSLFIPSQFDKWYFADDGPLFDSLSSFVEHYMMFADGLPTLLRYPVPPPGLKTRPHIANRSRAVSTCPFSFCRPSTFSVKLWTYQ